jgi:hypothetical protein
LKLVIDRIDSIITWAVLCVNLLCGVAALFAVYRSDPVAALWLVEHSDKSS